MTILALRTLLHGLFEGAVRAQATGSQVACRGRVGASEAGFPGRRIASARNPREHV